MNKIRKKLSFLISLIVLVVINYFLSIVFAKAIPIWKIIPIYIAGYLAYSFEMSNSISKRTRFIVNSILVILAVIILVALVTIYFIN